jgi:hypothetical protein
MRAPAPPGRADRLLAFMTMRHEIRALLLAALLGAAPLAAPLAAQRAAQRAAGLPVELGVDAAVVTDDASDATTVVVPLQRLRVGVFVSPRLSLEPTLAYERTGADGASASGFDGTLGLVAHLSGQPTGRARTTSLFVRPFVGLARLSFGSEDEELDASATQARVGAGLGLKLPVADRLAWRLEGVYARAFESDEFPSANRFGVNVGLSFHTR